MELFHKIVWGIIAAGAVGAITYITYDIIAELWR
jgi:hypothetical protein